MSALRQFNTPLGIGTTGASLDVTGNINASGSINALNLTMFRNRIINGNLSVDQNNQGAGIGGLTGTYFNYNAPTAGNYFAPLQPSSFNAQDRYTISSPNVGALVSRQVTLNSADIASIGGVSATAARIGLIPTDNLSIYLPFDTSINDFSENNVTTTNTGTMRYGPGVIATTSSTSGSLYLANEGNVTTGSTSLASNYLTVPSFTFPQQYTVSFWFNPNAFGSSDSVIFITNSNITSSSSLNNNVTIGIVGASTPRAIRLSTYNGSIISTTGYVINLNTWYHVVYTLSGNALALYFNGILVGSGTATVAHNGFKFGDSGNTSFYQPFAGFIDDFRIYNRVLSTTEITALATNVGTGIAPVSTSLLTQLTFDNTTADAQGGLPAPTVTGTAVYTPVCKTGTAALDVTANTTGNAAVAALTYTLSSGTYNVPITVSCWFNLFSTGAQVICSLGNSGGSENAALHIFTTNNQLYYNVTVGASTYTVNTVNTLTAGIWYHATITVNSSGYFNTYLNGILIHSVSSASGNLTVVSGGSGTPNQLRLGAKNGTSLLYSSKGFIDDVRIYNRVLSSAEVVGLYTSSQYASSSVFQQTIDGNNISDLGWGTTAAQPVNMSMWIKNNSSTAQQLSISLQNAGGNLLAWLPFENSYTDSLRFLNNVTTSGSVALSSSVVKVGSTSLDLSANTIGTAGVATVNYNIPYHIQPPLSVSCWIYASNPSGGPFQVLLALGAGVRSSSSDVISEIVINATGQLYLDIFINGISSAYQTSPSSATAIAANTWYHVCFTLSGNSVILYINGVAVSSNLGIPLNGILTNQNSYAVSQLRLGNQLSNGLYAYKGYLDDVRIYDVVLSPAQVLQLYNNNVTTTVSNNYLTPRSVVYNTPLISSNSWNKVSFTVPGDTSGNWLTTSDQGMIVSVCLASSNLYNTNNVANSSGNTGAVWNTSGNLMGGSVQPYANTSGTTLLSNINNSITITGLQLEEGNIQTQFDTRPFIIERFLTGIQPVLSRIHSVTQSITNNTDTSILYDTQDNVMTQSNTGITYNAGIFTNSSGRANLYTITANIVWDLNTTGTRAFFLVYNGITRYAQNNAAANNDYVGQQLNTTLFLQPNDTFTIRVWQNSGGTRTIQGNAPNSCGIIIIRL